MKGAARPSQKMKGDWIKLEHVIVFKKLNSRRNLVVHMRGHLHVTRAWFREYFLLRKAPN